MLNAAITCVPGYDLDEKVHPARAIVVYEMNDGSSHQETFALRADGVVATGLSSEGRRITFLEILESKPEELAGISQIHVMLWQFGRFNTRYSKLGIDPKTLEADRFDLRQRVLRTLLEIEDGQAEGDDWQSKLPLLIEKVELLDPDEWSYHQGVIEILLDDNERVFSGWYAEGPEGLVITRFERIRDSFRRKETENAWVVGKMTKTAEGRQVAPFEQGELREVLVHACGRLALYRSISSAEETLKNCAV